MICPSCSEENDPGRKFCSQCGSRLASLCPACGTANLPTDRFCGECGAALGQAEAAPPPERPVPRTERRLVTVLFADLVGFTTLSEHRDAEEVREILGDYYAVATEAVERFGGTVDKFVGDAVMAVWGVGQTHEDDAERAVRSALELGEAVGKLAAELGIPELATRVGVLTGEAAVGWGDGEEELVVGDLVNTASRLQSLATPGAVLVGESTYRATSRAIAYEDRGEHRVKGKEAPVRAYRAVGLLAMRGGEGRVTGLEAPFAGRAEELRLLKDLLQAIGRERQTRLVSIVGIAGIGKSRLVWEFKKYVDGLVEDVYWHEGRSPGYGEGVTFWALGEMVRRRAGITETEDEASATAKLRRTLEDYLPDDEERRWLEPRLGALLGLSEQPAADRSELYAAFRTFFERIAGQGTNVLVFEDFQWADAGLLDFVDELPDRWRDHPILVITLTRPELLERWPGWGAGRRNVLSLHLGPLPEDAMAELVGGLAPGLPERTARLVRERAAGVPLYAVELVRMLILEGDLVPDAGGAYRLEREPAELAIPDSLVAVISARLDRLDPQSRSLLQDAAVLGQTFTPQALEVLTGTPLQELQPLLADLVRKELLIFVTDPRSPEQGQYGFVQSLIREVAHGRLGREERRSRHLRAARHLESLEDEELASVVASHYLEAYRASGEGPQAEELAARAHRALRGAAERAAALHSHEQVLALCRQALTIPGEPAELAPVWERAGASALALARFEEAEEQALRAVEEYRKLEAPAAVARSSRLYATVFMRSARPERAVEILEAQIRAWGEDDTDPALAGLLTDLSRAYMLSGRPDETLKATDRALLVAERLELLPLVAEALVTRGTVLGDLGRLREGTALVREGLSLARQLDLTGTEGRAYINLAYLLFTDDMIGAMENSRTGLELARRLGNREGELFSIGNVVGNLIWVGRWEEARALLTEAEGGEMPELARLGFQLDRAMIDALQGDSKAAERNLAAVWDGVLAETDHQWRRGADERRAWVNLATGKAPEAYRLAAERARLDPVHHFGPAATAAHAALWWGDGDALAEVRELLEAIPRTGRVVRGVRISVDAGLAAVDGDRQGARAGFEEAASLWKELELPLDLALCRAECARLLGEAAPEAREEAVRLFEELGAKSFLRLLDDEGAP
ncbi:MAG: adenylate/guanylate cyclase domain-containing protein [Acidimicrobiia bacterium]